MTGTCRLQQLLNTNVKEVSHDKNVVKPFKHTSMGGRLKMKTTIF